jgi:hypothetical protein
MSVPIANVRKMVESRGLATPYEWHDTRMNDQSVGKEILIADNAPGNCFWSGFQMGITDVVPERIHR